MTETLFVRDGFAALAARLAASGARRALILCGPSRRFVARATAALDALDPVVFDGAVVHVPVEVVERAEAALRACGADVLVAIGGGAPIGLGKALRLSHDVRLVAVPTTYAGSEMTSIHGTTRGGDKQTGRDERVRPDLVVYDPALARDTPVALTTQSLCNALAHVASALPSLTDPLVRADALAAAAGTLRALEDLLMWPRALGPREHAARGASGCARALDAGRPGAQHGLAHLLGGVLGVEHAPLHALLLPQFLAHLRAADPATLAALEAAVDRPDLDAYLHDLLVRAGCPVALTALGPAATPDAVRAALTARPDLPAAIALDALVGLRPPGAGGRLDLGGAEALVLGPPPERARRIVLALHGRGAEAGTIARRMREIAGHDPDVCVVGLRAPAEPGPGDRWYAVRYGEPGAGADPEVTAAIGRVDAARRALAARAPGAALVLAGFSQGACLALEYAARHGAGLAAVIAPAGARVGRPEEWAPPPRLDGLPVLIGAARADRWIARADLDATAAWLRAAGAVVDDVSGPGDRHEITLRQRLRARELILGRPHPAGAPLGTLESEAREGAVPPVQNSPRVPAHGLYAEQLNGTGFTAPRAANARTWTYRVRPSAHRRASTPLSHPRLTGTFDAPPAVDLVGFAPLPPPAADEPTDFLDGLTTLLGAGDARARRGYALHRYAANRGMDGRALYDADGDLLILPEHGALTVMTELGPLDVAPGQLAVIPRGVVFAVLLREPWARGYVAEPFGRRFQLPERGPLGANGGVDARHLRAPAAWFEDRLAPDVRVVAKLGGRLHEASQDHSPFDVVGWHGDLAPFVYDLAAFCPVANVAFDHGDPSIYTVLTAPLDEAGAHTLDLVVFPTRWDATTGTFRPPFFHRNAVAEINGVVREPSGGAFAPGCVFVTPPFTGHGVHRRTVERIRGLTDAQADAPFHLSGALWFQLESALAPSLTPWAAPLDDWAATWGSHRGYFA